MDELLDRDFRYGRGPFPCIDIQIQVGALKQIDGAYRTWIIVPAHVERIELGRQ
jgi:hypothetical protein